MESSDFNIPAEWHDDLAELRESAAQLPEDEEDQWAREGQAEYDAMTPEERAAYDSNIAKELEKFQQPGVIEAVDEAFRSGF